MGRRTKILYIITKSNFGGAQRYVHDLATSLPKEEYEIAVGFGGTGEPHAKAGSFKSLLEREGIRTIFIKYFARDIFIFKEFLSLLELISLFKKEKPDVIHLNSSKAGGLGALAGRLSGVPKIIFTSHGLAYDEDRNIISRLLIFFTTWLTFLLCHHIITISQDTSTRARRLPFVRDKIVLIHNGIAHQSFLSKQEARKKLHVPENAFVIGTIGELTKNKGHAYLLRAAGIAKRDGKEFILCIVGEGEEKQNLEKIVAEEDLNGSIVMPGYIANGAQFLKAFDVFALPSLKEGLPYVLLEAGYAALPVIASNIPGVTDVMGKNGSCGLLHSSKNARDLANALKKLIDESTREDMGKSLEMRVKSEFSSSTMVRETLRLYTS
jgi:glycosyltransferase involved in cell wall biosynthesis